MRRLRPSSKFLFSLLAGALTYLVVSAAVAADSLAVYAVTPLPGHRSIYELQFSLNQPLPPDAVFEIHLPQVLNLEEVKVVGSQTIDGGFRLRRQGNVLLVERTGRGHVVPAGRRVDLKLANFRNPKVLDAGLQVRLVVRRGNRSVADVRSSVRWGAPPKVLAR